jgi:alpha-beta hydrolase superfamily lysophospholipase
LTNINAPAAPILRIGRRETRRPQTPMKPAIRHDALTLGPLALPGDLASPPVPAGLVLFVHGSGSSRLSPRNRYVAEVLQQHGLATLLFDLLTTDEADDRRKVFDIDLLTHRVGDALDAVRHQRPDLAALPVGLFGASTGAAAALRLAAARPQAIAAVVSRGGRPDLALRELPRVQAPTLLIVGGDDDVVLELNREALAALRCHKRLDVVPGATHLFEEPGTLETAARRAAEWFVEHLRKEAPR